MSVLEFTLAGAMTLRNGDLVVSDDQFRSRQLRLVAAMLLVDREHPVPVGRLVHALWPGGPPDRYRPALRGLVSKMRRVLSMVGVDGDRIRSRAGMYAVDLPELTVDLELAASALDQARDLFEAGDFAGAQEHAGTARAVLSRPVLPGIDSLWLDDLRDRVAVRHLESLLVLGHCRRRRGRPDAARPIVLEAIGIAPLREDAWRLAMLVEADSGNAAAALDLYEQVRRIVADELGTDPARETQDLHTAILRDVPDPAAAVVALDGPRDISSSSNEVPGWATEAKPYVGLRPFETRDAPNFFGREAATQELLARLIQHRAVAVVGASGVGKSSLVRAGLMPALARGAVPDSDLWNVAAIVPGHKPFASLAAALLESRHSDLQLDPASLAATLASDPLALHSLLAEGGGRGSAMTLLVVDQAEELFTLADPSDADAFVESLFAAASAARDAGPKLSVVMTMRADFYDRAASNARMGALLSRSQLVLSPLAGDGLELAITEPARRAGAHFEDGVVGRLVAEVGTKASGLPLLQHVLWELWETRDEHRLTLSSLEALGGVSGALARHAEETWQGLDGDQRWIARRLLLRTVTPTGSDATASPAQKAELYEWAPAQQVDDVVSALVEARLLTASTASGGWHDPDERAVVELAHEALIRGWPRLRRWVDDERETLMLARRIGDLTADWKRDGRDPSHLLRGSRLAHVERKGRLLDYALTSSDIEFVSASIEGRRRADAARLHRVTVKQSRKLAVEALATKAEDPERSALLALESVRTSRQNGLEPEPLAVGALHEASQASRLVRRFDCGSWLIEAAPDASWVIVEEADDSTNPVKVDLQTGSRRVFPGPRRSTTSNQRGIWSLAISPDGTQIAAGYRTDDHAPVGGGGLPAVVVFDVASGEICATLEAPPGIYRSLEYDRDGSLLAGINRRGLVVVWDATTHRQVATHEVGRDVVEVAFVPIDGNLLALSSNPAGLVRIDPFSGEQLKILELPHAGPCWMTIQPQAQLIALVYREVRKVVIRKLDTGAILHDWEATLPLCAAWSPDGTTIAHAGVGGVLTVRDVESGTAKCRLAGSTTVRDVQFLADGRHLVNTTSGGQGRMWDISIQGRPHLGAITVGSGKIEQFWAGTRQNQLGISFRSPPAFELLDTGTMNPVSYLPLDTGDGSPEVEQHELDARMTLDGNRVATLDSSGRSTLRGLPHLELLAEFEHNTRPIAISQSGDYVVLTAVPDETPLDYRTWSCRVVDTHTGKVLLNRSYGTHAAALTDSLSGAGPPVAVINAFMSDVDVFDLHTRQLVSSLKPTALGLKNHFGVSFSPDGHLLAGGSQEGLVWVVDMQEVMSGTPMPDSVVFAIESHTGPAVNPVVTDAGILATAGYDGHIRLWDIHKKALLADFTASLAPAQLPCLRFSQSEQALHYVEASTIIRRFPIDIVELMTIAETSVTRSLTDGELRRHDIVESG